MQQLYIWVGKNKDRKEKAVQRVCLKCGKDFLASAVQARKPNRAIYCSISCAYSVIASKMDHRKEKNGNWGGGVSHAERSRRFKAAYPEKAAAHQKMHTAIRNGSLIRKPCEICGNEKSEGHHDDYIKPLDVRWLCKKHHLEHHKKHPELS